MGVCFIDLMLTVLVTTFAGSYMFYFNYFFLNHDAMSTYRM